MVRRCYYGKIVEMKFTTIFNEEIDVLCTDCMVMDNTKFMA